MGLRTEKGLASFCAELASSDPSPGGGSASAAAGAMAASLLAMACKVTRKNKRFQGHWEELDALTTIAHKQMTALLVLVKDDADAYDAVLEAVRKHRQDELAETEAGLDAALKCASEVPMKTAFMCADVLELSIKVAEISIKNAASDIGTAVQLADAGFKGATMNVLINLRGLKNPSFVKKMTARLFEEEERARSSAKRALAIVQKALSS